MHWPTFKLNDGDSRVFQFFSHGSIFSRDAPQAEALIPTTKNLACWMFFALTCGLEHLQSGTWAAI